MTRVDITMGDLLRYIADQAVVTARDVATKCSISIEGASCVLNGLKIADAVNAKIGVYPWPTSTTVDDVLDRLDIHHSTTVESFMSQLGVGGEPSGDYQMLVAEALREIVESLHDLHRKVDNMRVAKPKKNRRRERGELLVVKPTDPPELVKARREAELELARVKASGTKAEYQTCYAKHINRINTLESRFGVGAFAVESDEEQCDSTECV